MRMFQATTVSGILFGLLFLLIFSLQSIFANGTYEDSGQMLGGDNSFDAGLADLDGDGDLDAFTANQSSNRLWINQGGQQGGEAGQFQNSGASPGFQSQGVALGELDNATSIDAFLAKTGVNEVWRNDGNGVFTLGQQLTASEADSRDVALGHFDGAPGLDAFVANDGANEVFLNNGGNLVIAQNDLGSGNSREVALGDVNDDGHLDAYVANGTTFFQQDELWLGNGLGAFTLSAQDLDGEWNEGVALGDIDADGDLDVFLATWFGEDAVWINQGNAQGGAAGVLLDSGQELSGSSSTDIALLDADGDSDLDAIVAKWSLPNELWENNGSGQFTKSDQQLDASATYEVAIGDVDADQDQDLFFANAGVNHVWLKGGLGLPGAWFDVDARQSPDGQDVYPWTQPTDADLPIRLGFAAPQPLEVTAHIESAAGHTSQIVDYELGELSNSLTVANPAPQISETLTISLTVNNQSFWGLRNLQGLVNPLRLTFIAAQNGPADCLLCLIDWTLKLTGFEPSFWQLHHVQLPDFEETPSWDYYEGLFQSSSAELTTAVLANPTLLWQSFEVLQAWTPGVVAAGEGQAHETTISQGMIDDANELMDGLAEHTSANLALRIDTERDVLGFDTLADVSLEQAMARVEQRIEGLIYFPVTLDTGP